jgi:head-tail adaptor
VNYNRVGIFELQAEANNIDGTGGEWEEISHRWYVSVEPLSGRELFVAQQAQSQTTHRIRCQWFDGLTTKHRLKIAKFTTVDEDDPTADANFRIFHLETLINVGEMNRQYEILAVEKT